MEELTSLIVADREGAVLHSRPLAIEDASGAPVSSATLHGLSFSSPDEGFLILAPTAIWPLDAAGAGDPIAIDPGPSADWQRSAGWIDDDRFLFVTNTPDLRLAVFARSTRAVTLTPISTRGAARVLVSPGELTISSAGPGTEVVVYDSTLSGAVILRSEWHDGTPVQARLLVATSGPGERTWMIRDSAEFRAALQAYRVPLGGDPIAVGASPPSLLSPVIASLEGDMIAIYSSRPTLTLFALDTALYTELPPPPGMVLVEPERDGGQVALLTLRPSATGALSIELTCGVP